LLHLYQTLSAFGDQIEKPYLLGQPEKRMRSPIFLHTAVKMNADSARFLEPSQKVYELDTQYTRCQQPSIHPYKEERGGI